MPQLTGRPGPDNIDNWPEDVLELYDILAKYPNVLHQPCFPYRLQCRSPGCESSAGRQALIFAKV